MYVHSDTQNIAWSVCQAVWS